MEQNLISQFNLPKYIKGKSFGEAASMIQSKFKDRNDVHSNGTKEELLGRLAKAQEYIKMQQALKTESQQVPDMMNGQIPEGMEQYAEGGFFGLEGLDADASLGDKFKTVGGSSAGNAVGDIASAIGPNLSTGNEALGTAGQTIAKLGQNDPSGIVSGVGNLVEFGNDAFGKSNIDKSGAVRAERVSGGLKAATSGLKGAATGAKIGGPVGAGIGAALGVASGIIGAKKHNAAAAEANHNYVLGQNAGLRQSDFAYGGPFKPFNEKEDFENNPVRPVVEGVEGSAQSYAALKGVPIGTTLPSERGADLITPVDTKEWSGLRKGIHNSGNWLGENAGNIMQYAPMASNLLELKNLKQAITPRGARLDNTYKPYVQDEVRNMNLLNQQNTERALTESSGGDMGALRSNLLGSQINKLKAASDIRANQTQQEANENKMAQEFNFRKDSTNVGLENQFLDKQAQDKAAYENTKSNLKRALAEDTGKIGKEMVDKKTVERMFGYKWNAKYKKYEDEEGNFHSRKDVDAKIKAQKSDGTDDKEYQEFLTWKKSKKTDE